MYASPDVQAVLGETWRPGGLALTRRGLVLCAWPAGALVADVGCGPGGTLRLLRESGLRALGIDHRPVTFESSGLSEVSERVDVVAADAAALPLSDAVLNGVVCECVLSLLSVPAWALREFFRVLKPGGRLLLSDLTRTTAECGERNSESCLGGALPVLRMRGLLREAGFVVLHEEDHRQALKELAAQLLWHGVPCGCLGGGHGYGLWVAEKEGEYV